MMLTHLLQNLGLPTALATVVGVVAMLIRGGTGAKGAKGRPGRSERGRRSARDDH